MVTGAGKNIGREIALNFAKNGANIVVCDYNRENADNTAKEILQMGVGVLTAVCDVRDRAKIFEYVDATIKKFGKIDVLVNNAGGSAALLNKLTRFADAEESTLDFVIDTNVKGAFHCTQAVLKSMIKQKSVEDEVQEKIEKEKLKKAKSVLTETQKRRIELYIEEGMSLGKIAQIEGVGKSKIDKSISQGIKKIKKFLNEGVQNQ